jgi:DNA gyrase subunit B
MISRQARNSSKSYQAAWNGGDKQTFLPSKQVFTTVEFDFATLAHRLREFSDLNSGVTAALSDVRQAVENARSFATTAVSSNTPETS